MPKNNPTPTPGGAPKIQTTADQESAAGVLPLPPEALPGGRADGLSARNVADLGLAVHADVSEIVQAIDSMPGSIRRALGPVLQAGREFAARLAIGLTTLDAAAADEEAAAGGQKSPDREGETPIVPETGGQDVETGAEIAAVSVVHDEDGNEVER